MKKKKIIIIFIPIIIAVLILSGFFILNNKKGFRGIKWGMSMNEVKALEKSKGSTSPQETYNNGKNLLGYKNIKWNNYNAAVAYGFNNTLKLDEITVGLGMEDTLTNKDMNNIVINLQKELSSKDIETKTTKLTNGTLTTTTITSKDTKTTLMESYSTDTNKIQCIIHYEPIK